MRPHSSPPEDFVKHIRDYTLVFSFPNALRRVGGASVTSGTGLVISRSIDSTDRTITSSISHRRDERADNHRQPNERERPSRELRRAPLPHQRIFFVAIVNGNGVVSNAGRGFGQSSVLRTGPSSNFRNDVSANDVISRHRVENQRLR